MIDPASHVVAESMARDLAAHYWSGYDGHHDNARRKLHELALLMGYKLVPLDQPKAEPAPDEVALEQEADQ